MKRFGLSNFLNIIFPAIVIIIIGYVSFTDVFIQQTDHKYFFITLIIIYPALFLLQGVITAILKSNILISLGISSLGYFITIFIWANSSAIGYIFVYLLFGFLGYGVVRLFQKRKR
ncbi:hypothetical protein BGM26_06675 [Bacillus sp. FJAT-29790]|uniref:hypothetical protein n=1 Tax=Bacillus sp. FJAT-29790 TaxID=1895002 RepID=UPI001C217A7F|nr:hypothetical protein [Bacillus sp. FJAT-29790]MBU8878673.1 hypothetical protein [Bacillus sp. FJAT-29790]